jgi:hypothetical protein
MPDFPVTGTALPHAAAPRIGHIDPDAFDPYAVVDVHPVAAGLCDNHGHGLRHDDRRGLSDDNGNRLSNHHRCGGGDDNRSRSDNDRSGDDRHRRGTHIDTAAVTGTAAVTSSVFTPGTENCRSRP